MPQQTYLTVRWSKIGDAILDATDPRPWNQVYQGVYLELAEMTDPARWAVGDQLLRMLGKAGDSWIA